MKTLWALFVFLAVSGSVLAKSCPNPESRSFESSLSFSNLPKKQGAFFHGPEHQEAWIYASLEKEELRLSNKSLGAGIPLSVFRLQFEHFNSEGEVLEEYFYPGVGCMNLTLFPGDSSHLLKLHSVEGSNKIVISIWSN